MRQDCCAQAGSSLHANKMSRMRHGHDQTLKREATRGRLSALEADGQPKNALRCRKRMLKVKVKACHAPRGQLRPVLIACVLAVLICLEPLLHFLVFYCRARGLKRYPVSLQVFCARCSRRKAHWFFLNPPRRKYIDREHVISVGINCLSYLVEHFKFEALIQYHEHDEFEKRRRRCCL
jgi:hypothetical protein